MSNRSIILFPRNLVKWKKGNKHNYIQTPKDGSSQYVDRICYILLGITLVSDNSISVPLDCLLEKNHLLNWRNFLALSRFELNCKLKTHHTVLIHWINVFVCLSGILRHTREHFTHMVASPLPVKGCKFWPVLGTHGDWAVGVL